MEDPNLHEDRYLDSLITPPSTELRASELEAARALVSSVSTRNLGDSTVRVPRKSAVSQRKWRTGAAIVGGLAALLVGGFAAAPATADFVTTFLAQSGLFAPDDPDDEFAGSGELINLNASDLPQYLEHRTQEPLPLPPGISPEAFDGAVLELLGNPHIPDDMLEPAESPDDVDVLTTDLGIQRTYEWLAWTAWLAEWLDAHEMNDEGRLSQAAQVLQDATEWHAMVETDGGGVIADMQNTATAAAIGDAAVVQASFDMMILGSEDVLDGLTVE